MFCHTVEVDGLKTEKTDRKNILTYETASTMLTKPSGLGKVSQLLDRMAYKNGCVGMTKVMSV